MNWAQIFVLCFADDAAECGGFGPLFGDVVYADGGWTKAVEREIITKKDSVLW